MAVTPLDLRQKEEDSLSVSFRGFPVRSLTRNVEGRANGEWILAYQMHQKQRLKLSVGSATTSITSTNGANISFPVPGNTPSNGSAHQRHILDTKLLLKKGYVDRPLDLCIIDISGLELNHFRDSEFHLFTNLVSVNASDNQLPFEAFQSFPMLEELELPLNGLTNIGITHDTFVSLTILDLSYNYLTNTSVTALGRLPQLMELHLTGNNFVSLPNDMSRPHKLQSTDTQESEIRISFPQLEKLWLDENKLCDPTTFAVLAGLRKLKYLNLDNNELTSIPHLKLLGTGLLQGRTPSQRDSAPSTLRDSAPSTIRDSAASTQKDATPSTLKDTAPSLRDSAHSLLKDTGPSTLRDSTHSLQSKEGSGPITSSGSSNRLSSSALAPFPQLHTISLCNNMVVSSSGLLPCSSWPVLKELIIVGNPLVSIQRGLPEVLQHELIDKCSINIIRGKQVEKRKSIERKVKHLRKVSVSPPPLIPKQPIPLAIEAPPTNQLEEGTGSILSLTNNDFPDSDNEESLSIMSSVRYSQTSSHHQQQGDNPVPTSGDTTNKPGVFLTEFNQATDEDPNTAQTTKDSNVERPSNGQHNKDDQGMTQHSRNSKEAGNDEPQMSVKEMFDQKRKMEKEKFSDVPDKYKGFESLLDYDEQDETYYDAPPLPKGQRSCSQVLKYALDHPLLAKTTRSKKSKQEIPAAITMGTTGEYLKQKPIRDQYHATPAISSRKQKESNLIEELKSHQTSIEVNLRDVLDQKEMMKTIITAVSKSADNTASKISHHDSNSKGMVKDRDENNGESTELPSAMTKKEGQVLLTKLQTKYDKIREVSLATVAAIDSAHHTAKIASREHSSLTPL